MDDAQVGSTELRNHSGAHPMSTEPRPWEIFRCPTLGLHSEKEHAQRLDETLGLRCEQIEASLIQKAQKISPSSHFHDWGPALHGDGQQTWVGLPVQSLMTPYSELLRMLETLNPRPGSTLTDLGAGYGRLGYITAVRYPEVKCLGFEWVQERIDEGNRVFGALQRDRFSLKRLDLGDKQLNLPSASAHFVYDLGSLPTIRNVLEKIKLQARHQAVAVVGRGKATRHLIETENPWLSQVISPEHHDTFTIYRSS
jgi:hypothetical protein